MPAQHPSRRTAVSGRRPKSVSGLFSPGGRLLQVEYARDCPQSAPLAVAMIYGMGVVLAKAHPLAPELGFRAPSFWPVNRQTAYVANGNLGDLFYIADILLEKGPKTAREASAVIRRNIHEHALRVDVRPLAVLILLATVERGRPELVGFDVSGSQFEANAWAMGLGNARARRMLEKGWRPGLSLRGCLSLLGEVYGARPFETRVLTIRKKAGDGRKPRASAKGKGL